MTERLRWSLAVHFTLLAFLTSLLISIGEGSFRLPMLIGATAIASLIFTDWLGWFSLHRYLGYVGMILGAIIALNDFFRTQSSYQLYSIATMLVYAEIVLLLQKKTRRIFEQLGIFILLELVVAALVNDNVLFGILLLPILAVSLSTLILFTHYVALSQEGKDHSKDRFSFQKLLHDLLPRFGSSKQQPLQSQISLKPVQSTEWPLRLGSYLWFLQAVPLGISTIGFSCFFFYLLPRTNRSTYEAPSWAQPVVGFTESLALDQFGEVLRSKQLVMRVSFRNLKTGEAYNLIRAPYLRGVVLDDYEWSRSRTGTWKQRRQIAQVPLRDLPTENMIRSEKREGSDWVSVRFAMEKSESPSLFCVAPTFAIPEEDLKIHFVPEDWRIYSQEFMLDADRGKVTYSIGTSQFRGGIEMSLMPEASDFFLDDYAERIRYNGLTPQRRSGLTNILVDRLPKLIELTESVLDKAKVDKNLKVDVARTLERYLASGVDYTYTLDLTAPRDTALDAIEDFVVNQKKGHCQYFAATLAMMLRSQKIPARLVAGYRPDEYNELGKYFTVRQQDAHTWVEAYFTAEQLKESGLFAENDLNHGAWLRLDPTPASEDSNSSDSLQRQRSMPDFIQEIWNRNVLEMNQFRQGGNLYDSLAEGGGNPYADAIRQIQIWIIKAQEGDFSGGMLAPGQWFSLPVAAWIIGLGSLCAVVGWTLATRFQNLFFPFPWRRTTSGDMAISVKFFERCMYLLARLGFKRKPWETPAEVTQSASVWLDQEQQIPQASQWLQQLTDAYYKTRFGKVSSETLRSEKDSSKTAEANQSPSVNIVDRESESLEQTIQQLEQATKHIKPRSNS
jgi:hypothetical protein